MVDFVSKDYLPAMRPRTFLISLVPCWIKCYHRRLSHEWHIAEETFAFFLPKLRPFVSFRIESHNHFFGRYLERNQNELIA